MIFGLFGGGKHFAAEKIGQVLAKETNFYQIHPEFGALSLSHEINDGQFHLARALIAEGAKNNSLLTDGLAPLNIEASSEDACLPVMQAFTDAGAGADVNFSPNTQSNVRIAGLYDANGTRSPSYTNSLKSNLGSLFNKSRRL